MTQAEVDEAGPLVDRALAEVGAPGRTQRAAVLRLAREVAKAISADAMRPYDGAKQIWELTLRVPAEHFPDLDPFVYAASEWEDRPEDRPLFDQGIRAAAAELATG